jgi:hypothetical protein
MFLKTQCFSASPSVYPVEKVASEANSALKEDEWRPGKIAVLKINQQCEISRDDV